VLEAYNGYDAPNTNVFLLFSMNILNFFSLQLIE